MSKEERNAHLHWASTNHQQPSFCNPIYKMDVTRLKATPETIAAIFGVKKAETITMREMISDEEPGSELELVLKDEDKFCFWPLEPEKDYWVETTHKGDADADADADPVEDSNKVIPIGQIFPLFPGDTEEAKMDSIQKLSNNFYAKIWHDEDTPKGFRDAFYSRFSSYEIQAYRQFNWFSEVFGGPSLVGEEHRESILLSKTLAKHTASRMTMNYSVIWLNLMRKSIGEVFPNEPKLQEALGLYWLHFFAYFPFNDDERREFRRLILPNANPQTETAEQQ